MNGVQEFIEDVQQSLQKRPRHILKRKRQAGILLPFIFDEKEPRLLVTKRADSLSAHRGEIAFPGGMKDPIDQHIVATALREAQEEIGLNPSSVKIIGQIDDLISKNTDIMVTPSIGVIQAPIPTWKANPNEVAKIFEIPLSELYKKERWRTEKVNFRGRKVEIYYFAFEKEQLWGLSAYATLLALDVTKKGSPVDLNGYYRQIDQVRQILK